MSVIADRFPHYRDYATLVAAINFLNWDQQVMMPSGGASARAQHMGRLRKMAHQLLTSDEMARDLERVAAEAEPGTEESAAVEALRRDLKVQSRIPVSLVERKAAITSQAYEVWREARPANDYARMEPYYREVFNLARETADAIGWSTHPYDPLIGLYEYGATYADARRIFDALTPATQELLGQIRESSVVIDDSALAQNFEPEALRAFAQAAATQVGFKFNKGRLDVCRNAFCANFGADDVRMTTRPSNHFKGIVSSSLHEMGHALYEQNVNPAYSGSPLQGGISLAVHESQSRLWENVVGRSHGFWQHFLPVAASMVPSLDKVSPDQMFAMMNKVQAEPIRVGADEISYNMHILVRFELEVELITGQITTKQLPEAWNEKYRRYLGLEIPNDTLGCLQDVHWSKGSVGYFPTYTFGNMIGLQIWDGLIRDLGDQESAFAKGDFRPTLDYLTEKVYQHGRRFAPRDLVVNITGEPMQPHAWIQYAKRKYRDLYQVSAA